MNYDDLTYEQKEYLDEVYQAFWESWDCAEVSEWFECLEQETQEWIFEEE